MSVGTIEVIDYYNNMLPVMEKYHNTPNARIDRIKNMLNIIILPDMFVLDVGCGTGLTSKYMADIGASVVAVDIAPKLIEYATKNSYHDNIVYKVADICSVDLNQKFDAIILADVVEHIDPSKLFDTIIRLVQNNTTDETLFYLNIPDANFINFISTNYPEKLQIIDQGYTIDFIVKLFKCNGFIPSHILIYGIDSSVQYNEFVFMKNVLIEKHYTKCIRWAKCSQQKEK